MAQMVSPQMMILPAAAANPSAKDSRWLTLEVCREFQRSKCSRTETECKFAHPPPHVEVQNGRVVACFDSIKGKCQRKDPPCKYLHPPQHLREQLLQNGRNNLILKNMQLQAYQQHMAAGVMPVTGTKTLAMTTVLPGHYPYLNPYALSLQAPNPANPYNPYITTSMPAHSVAMTTNGDANSPIISQALQHTMIPATPKAVRADKFEAPQVQENGECLASHSPLLDTFNIPTYLAQPPTAAAAPGTLPHQMVLTKKRPRDPADDLFLSSVPGIVPAYKRIAVGDATIGKGGIPFYPSSHLMSPYQQQAHSLVPLQQHPSYIPMPYHLSYNQPLAGHPPSVPRF